MVLGCCVCGVEYEKDLPRTFHTFPKNEAEKQKWFLAIGKEVTYKGAVVCSDHFLLENFTRSLPSKHTSRKRLIKGTIPSVFEVNSQVDNINNDTNDNIDDVQSSKFIEDEENPEGDTSNKVSKKRKNKSLIFSRKKFKVTIGNQTEWLSKDDFTSQKSWRKFLHFVKATRTHKDTTFRGLKRIKKQENTVKNLLKTLQEKELLSNKAKKC